MNRPHSTDNSIKLIPPYINGTGKDGNVFFIYHNPPVIHKGVVIDFDQPSQIAMVQDSEEIEDLFENIAWAVCIIIANDAKTTIPQNVRKVYPMYSAHSEP